MNLATVMQEIADRLNAAITELNCFGYPAPKYTPPAAIVSYPEDYTFDATYGRGMDRMTLPVGLVVGKVSAESTRDQLAAYCNGSGPRSIKAVLESGSFTAFDVVTVTGIEFDVVTISAVDYMAAVFTLDIAGQGSP